jgi:hypothetical protein
VGDEASRRPTRRKSSFRGNSPEESVPCVLKRLELTLEEMKKEKIAHKERWAEQSKTLETLNKYIYWKIFSSSMFE